MKTEFDNIESHEGLSNPPGTAQNLFVATRDSAKAAFVALKEEPERHTNNFHDLTRSDFQSIDDIAQDLRRAINMNIEHHAQSMINFENNFGNTRTEFFILDQRVLLLLQT